MNFNWTSESAKALGIQFYNDPKKNLTENLHPKIQDFKNCLKQWQHRKLTLLGKVTVIKTYALPKLIYPFTVLPNPAKDIIDDITKSMFAFLWDNKVEKIKRKTVIQNYSRGGLNLTDIYAFLNSIKSCWARRIFDPSKDNTWKCF